jgi:TnpA family transposase
LRDRLGDLAPVLTRAIDWELIERQYDEMIKYTAALRRGTADPGVDDFNGDAARPTMRRSWATLWRLWVTGLRTFRQN